MLKVNKDLSLPSALLSLYIFVEVSETHYGRKCSMKYWLLVTNLTITDPLIMEPNIMGIYVHQFVYVVASTGGMTAIQHCK